MSPKRSRESAVGHITLIDSDDIEPTNINRQIIALESTLGHAERLTPCARVSETSITHCAVAAKKDVRGHQTTPRRCSKMCVSYAVDAVDNVSAKLAIAEACGKKGIRVISAMGAG